MKGTSAVQRDDLLTRMLYCYVAISYEAALSPDAEMLVDFHLAELRRAILLNITKLKIEQ